MKRTAIYLALIGLVASPPVFASVDQALVDEMRAQIAALTQRLNQLEANAAIPDVAANPVADSAKVATPVAAWSDKITLSGDFRYRYESIDTGNDSSRDRNRIRARLGLKAKVTDTINFNLGLASGGSDPVSTNQTLGDAASTKNFRLDMAYMEWRLSENTHLIAGKMKNPFYMPNKSLLMWDGDYRPEGLAAKYDNGSFFATAGYHFLESDNKGGRQETPEITALQAGYRTALSEDSSLTFGAGYFDIGVKGTTPLLGDLGLGNTLDDNRLFLYDYQNLELFAELKTSMAGQPLVLFADFAQNQDADDHDTGWAVGAKFGTAKNPGTWELGYIYQHIEADSVYALLNDSDFGGGDTDSKGHLLKAAYAFEKGTTIGATLFFNDVGEVSRSEEFDYDRLQVDVTFKF